VGLGKRSLQAKKTARATKFFDSSDEVAEELIKEVREAI
jgi:hypothetical protein